jgi:hypothetical protein
MLVL